MFRRHDAHELKDLNATTTMAVDATPSEGSLGEPTARSKHVDQERVRDKDNSVLQELGYKPQLNVSIAHLESLSSYCDPTGKRKLLLPSASVWCPLNILCPWEVDHVVGPPVHGTRYAGQQLGSR